MLDLDVSFSHVKFQVCKMKGSEVTAVSAGDVFSAIFSRLSGDVHFCYILKNVHEVWKHLIPVIFYLKMADTHIQALTNTQPKTSVFSRLI